MSNNTDTKNKIHSANAFAGALEEVLREGARKLLQQAIENEVEEYINKNISAKEQDCRRSVVRNGKLPARSIMTGIGPVTVQQPRIRDKREGCRFSSALLPKYARKAPSIESVIPTLYLKGISSNDFSDALEALLGKNVGGLSASTICRLKDSWKQEYKEWKERDLSEKHYVYMWADGIHFNVRLTDERPCILVLIGALPSGQKEIIGILDGHRESSLSWKELLLHLKRKGLARSPSLAIGDGALGFWKALEEVFPETKQQRCWVHKTANLLDKMPKTVQSGAKRMIHEMYLSPTKKDALKAFSDFVEIYEAKYPRACHCLKKDKEELFTFYDFPAMHWQHIRTTNPIESTFATVRHRSRLTKGCGSREATLSMVFKLSREAEKGWQKLRGSGLISKVVEGVKFIDGEEKETQENVA
jgi:putative transposase